MKQYESRDEWLKARQHCVSSTESAALFGASPFATAYEIAVYKSQKLPEPDVDNDRTRWGARLENSIAQGIADDYNVIIESQEYVYAVHPEHPRMGSSFDFRIVDAKAESTGGFTELGELVKQHGPGLLEIKNVDWLIYKNWPEDDAPDHIEIQVQHELEVAQLDWCVLGVLVGGNRTEIYTRMRDREVGRAIVAKVEAFWKDLEKGVMPPVVMPQDADIIMKLYGYAEPNKVFDGQADETLADLCRQYDLVSGQLRESEKLQKSTKAMILQHIGNAERAFAPGYSVSAAMVAEAQVQAYTRRAYRNFKLTKKKDV